MKSKKYMHTPSKVLVPGNFRGPSEVGDAWRGIPTYSHAKMIVMARPSA
jgi:hypothetical protein